MLFTAVDHPAIACYDVRQQTEWYCRHLGMRVIARGTGDAPAAVVGYDADAHGGAMIELMGVRDAGLRPAEAARFAPGIRHIALRVRNFDEAYEQLKAAGVTFVTEPGVAVGGGRIASFRDPEGNELQIVER